MNAADKLAHPLQVSDSVRQQITAALALKSEILSSLSQAADALTGQQRRQLLHLIEQVKRVENPEQVLRSAQLLELFLPLTTAQTEPTPASGSTRQSHLGHRVFEVIQRQNLQSRSKQERWAVLVYPLSVLLIAVLVLAFIAISIVPLFEQMFDEFGLTRPVATQWVFAVSHLMQSVWFWVVVAGLLAVPIAMLAMRALDRTHQFISGSADSWFSPGRSTRHSLGDLAWHTALLLDAGERIDASVAIAAAASRKAAVRQASSQLPLHFGVANPAAGSPDGPLQNQSRSTATNRYLGVPCHLLTYALNTRQDGGKQSAMLREVAKLYWDREQKTSIWLLSWLQPLAVFMIGTTVGFVVLALFMPLVDLISGLT